MFLPSIRQLHHQIFNIAKASPEYSLKVDLTPNGGSSEEPLTGKARVTIVSRTTHKSIQTIAMASIAIFKDQLSTSVGPQGKQPALYDDEYTFVFEDFNFDGRQDLAVCKDIQGSYGAPTYDIFLWNPARKQFVRNAQLSKLSSEHLGLLQVDRKSRELITFDKSGAAWHLTSTYKYVHARPKLVETKEEDASGGVHDVITTRRLIGNHWRKQVKVIPIPN